MERHMTTIWHLPRIEILDLNTIDEKRPAALLTGEHSWQVASSRGLNLPLVIQAEPHKADHEFFKTLSKELPPQVEVIYAVGGGLVADCAKYIGWVNKLPVVVVPTSLSVDGFFTALVAVREGGSVHYVTTGPAESVIIDWEVISGAPAHLRGTGICELLSIVTGLLDWRYAAERNKTTQDTRFQPWAAGLAAGIAQQAFKIAEGVGQGRVESLRNLLDLMCTEVALTGQIGHNRPQEGSEQYFAYAIEGKTASGYGVPYADLVGPGILIAAALHGQDIGPIRDTIQSAGIRLDQLQPSDIEETLRNMPDYVRKHNLPYSIFNEWNATSENVANVLSRTGLDMHG
jgi:glycerol-1-phosphate dehydrogenase [NAD(P)+]